MSSWRRAWAVLLVLGACANANDVVALIVPKATLAELQDPETCKGCHLEHYREWASSMHAYSARDPVFIAMNERGQRETGGELGDFCIKCHAPMALELGLTQDGLNLPDLTDPNARGVTCYFCHDVKAVEGDHNRALVLAHDTTLRAGIGGGNRVPQTDNAAPAVANAAHRSQYSPLHDGAMPESAQLCGACHDIVNGQGVALERTYAEWKGSRFSHPGETRTCTQCHMSGYAGKLAANAPDRELHRHLWPGVDIALEDGFPGVAAQSAAIQCAFAGNVQLSLEPDPSTAPPYDHFVVSLTNFGVGHAWPSGATQDRRAWVEFIAYDADGGVILQSGVVADGEVVGAQDPELEVLGDRLYDENGKPVHMFWQAAPSEAYPQGFASDLLPARRNDDSFTKKTLNYVLPTPAARVTARLRLQSIGLDVLDDFAGIDLPITQRVLHNVYQNDPTLRSRVPTITVPGTEHELELDADGVVTSTWTAPDQDCGGQKYVSLLSSE